MGINTSQDYAESPVIYQPGTIILDNDFGMTINAVPIMTDNNGVHETKYNFVGLMLKHLTQTYLVHEQDQVLTAQSLRLKELLDIKSSLVQIKRGSQIGRLGTIRLFSNSFFKGTTFDAKLEQYKSVFDRYVLVNGVTLLYHKVILINSQENYSGESLAIQLGQLDKALITGQRNARQIMGLEKIHATDEKTIEELVQESSPLAQTPFSSRRQPSKIHAGYAVKNHACIDTMINTFKFILQP